MNARFLLFFFLSFLSPIFATDIFDAIRAGDCDRVREFLDAGVPVEEQSREGYYPIVLAIELQDESIVGLLLDRGADPDYLWMFANGNQKIIDLLETARGRRRLRAILERRGQNIVESLRDREIYGHF
jgi:ankyrin repeat protein